MPNVEEFFYSAYCPGSTQGVEFSRLPHGELVRARRFSSLVLSKYGFGNTERIVYEVHLLSSGLAQIGWSATPSSLPYSENEGVGDFPLSVAADGYRQKIWNVTGISHPALTWKSGDILTCYADLESGCFEFSLNGKLCASHTLPTKEVLIRRKALWFTNKESIDETLLFYPCLSLDEGEAVVVNSGCAPLLFPREGYHTPREYELLRIRQLKELPSSLSIFILGETDIFGDFNWKDVDLLDLTCNSQDFLFNFFAAKRKKSGVKQFFLQAANWYAIKPIKHWKGFVLLLFFYVNSEVKHFGHNRGLRTDLDQFTENQFSDLLDVMHLLSVCLPVPLFGVVTKFLFTVVQHRLFYSPATAMDGLMIMKILIEYCPPIRRAWIGHTLDARCHLFNMFWAASLVDKEESERVTEVLADPSLSITKIFERSSEIFKCSQKTWIISNQIVCAIVNDEYCRGLFSFVLQSFISHRRDFNFESTTNQKIFACLPYAYSSALTGFTVAFLFLSVADTFSDSLPMESLDEERISPTSGLQWRASAYHYLPPEVFYGRPLGSALRLGRIVDEMNDSNVRFDDAAADIRIGGTVMKVLAEVENAVEKKVLDSFSDEEDSSDTEEEAFSVSRRQRKVPQSTASKRIMKVPKEKPNRFSSARRESESCEQLWGRLCKEESHFGAEQLEALTGQKHFLLLISLGCAHFLQRSLNVSLRIPEFLSDLLIHYRYSYAQTLEGCTASEKDDANTVTSVSTSSLCALREIMLGFLENSSLLIFLLQEGRGKKFVIFLGMTLSFYWAEMSEQTMKDNEGCGWSSKSAPAVSVTDMDTITVVGQHEVARGERCAIDYAKESGATCPNSAYLFIPLPLMDFFVEMWVFFVTTTGFGEELIEEFPNIALSFYDTTRRLSISHPQTREQLYHSMASLLGVNENQRLLTATLLTNQTIDPLSSDEDDESCRNGSEMRNSSYLVSSIQDCLRLYTHETNYNDSTALNFLFALQQTDGCLLPPPRMLDERFWWLSQVSKNTLRTRTSYIVSTQRRSHCSADNMYLMSFKEIITKENITQYLLANINKCNQLLTQISPQLPVRLSEEMTSADIRNFVAQYKVLRKNLYLFELLCKVFSSFEERLAEKRESTTDTSRLSALRRAIVDLILQSLIRIPFAPNMVDTVDNRHSIHSNTYISPSDRSISSAKTYLSQISSSSNSRSRAKVMENVLLGHVTQDELGAVVSSNVSCTVTGLLSPVFAVLFRILNDFGLAIESNPFLNVSKSDLTELSRRALTALSHEAWWEVPDRSDPMSDNNCTHGVPQKVEDNIFSDDEFLPPNVQNTLSRLKRLLEELHVKSKEFSNGADHTATPSSLSKVNYEAGTNSSEKHPNTNTKRELGLCLICQDSRSDISFIPCGHECCEMCFARYRNNLEAADPTHSNDSICCFFCKRKIISIKKQEVL